ncbi:hypothetical protein GUITHDRAFT_153999, partial [Guillardia theta CCMP2712]|uniref:Uncharacterized protein n=2 Tax=Guillardia theta TaxID=55529 RepID=A0A7S4UCB2_GUITH|mmetsp:Transcript_51855/g.161334  ORF Transcript_51855/g.161334 Transcript_51855/m.161334 type:complete len:222 (+) Transcript_51855:140-805(+)
MRTLLKIVIASSCLTWSLGFQMGSSPLTHAKLRSPATCSPRPALSVRHAAVGLRMAGPWGPDKEKPKASKELMQIRFSQVDASQLRDFIQKWPRGTSKDGFGLPKLMLPVAIETSDGGVKLVWKGSEDPWIQIDLEGDTVRVYRQSMMSGSFTQVSALKEREEKKICDKLKQDLEKSSYGKGMTEKEIPVVQIQEPKAEEKQEEVGDAEGAEKDAPASGQQ